MKITDLHEILAIYFDLTERPEGKALVMGEMSIESYIYDVINNSRNMIDSLLKKKEMAAGGVARYDGLIRKYQDRIDRAENWQARGYIG